MAKKEYPLWRKLAWRFGRTSLAVFLLNLSFNLEKVGSLDDVVPLLLLPALSAVVVTAGKALREAIASEDYDHVIHKLVV